MRGVVNVLELRQNAIPRQVVADEHLQVTQHAGPALVLPQFAERLVGRRAIAFLAHFEALAVKLLRIALGRRRRSPEVLNVCLGTKRMGLRHHVRFEEEHRVRVLSQPQGIRVPVGEADVARAVELLVRVLQLDLEQVQVDTVPVGKVLRAMDATAGGWIEPSMTDARGCGCETWEL